MLYNENGEEKEYNTAYPFTYVEAQTGGGGSSSWTDAVTGGSGGSGGAGGGSGGGGSEGGYEFQLTLNSSEEPLSYPFYDWTGIRCVVESLDGSDKDSIDLDMRIGTLDEIVFINLKPNENIYTNQAGFAVTGYAMPSTTVTVTYTDYDDASITGDGTGHGRLQIINSPPLCLMRWPRGDIK